MSEMVTIPREVVERVLVAMRSFGVPRDEDSRRTYHGAILYLESALAAGEARPEPVAVITECEACFTPDVCQLRGTCDHYSAEWLRIAAPPQPAEQPRPALLMSDERVRQYVADYVLDADSGVHVPTEGERFMLYDAISGLSAEEADPPQPAEPSDAMVERANRAFHAVLFADDVRDLTVVEIRNNAMRAALLAAVGSGGSGA